MSERYLDREALLLRSRDLGEADRLVWFVTREEGRSQAVVRGVRKPRARLGGSLQPLSLVRLTLYDGRRLSVMGASVVSSFRTMKGSYEGLQAGTFMAELLLLGAPEGEESSRAFNLAVEAFQTVDGGGDPFRTALLFARDLLAVLGWGIDFATCGVCQRPVAGQAYVRPHVGVVTHAACLREGLALDAGTVRSLAGDAILPGAEAGTLKILLALWQGHLEGPLRTAGGMRETFLGRT